VQRDHQAALVRAEINAVLPKVVQQTDSAGKKTTTPRKKRGRPPGRRTNT
jgi:hypothetical protein